MVVGGREGMEDGIEGDVRDGRLRELTSEWSCGRRAGRRLLRYHDGMQDTNGLEEKKRCVAGGERGRAGGVPTRRS